MELMSSIHGQSRLIGTVLLALSIGAGGCTTDAPSVPSALIDGSAARSPPALLEGAEGPSVATNVRVVQADALSAGSRSASCIASIGGSASGDVVERVGVSGVSVTFFGVAPSPRTTHGCDASVAEPGDREWCGFAFGRLVAGRLPDARLSLSCRDHNGDPVGFAWVQPHPDATYVAVQQPGYAEVYRVVGNVPVRVTTSDVDVLGSRATFSISEHANDGRRLREYEVEPQVAG